MGTVLLAGFMSAVADEALSVHIFVADFGK
jgi:hypothetical protein